MGDFYEEKEIDALPLHPERVDNFKISSHEITYDEFDAFARLQNIDLPSDEDSGRGQRAVVMVTWDEALAYCSFFDYRLPTEREWEYAARGKELGDIYSGTTNADSLFFYARVQENTEAPFSFLIGSKRPNDWGLFDMSGNVYEWIGDFYQIYPDSVGKETWIDLEASSIRMIRGGSFRSEKNEAMTFQRAGTLRDVRSEMIGFRCAKDN